MKTIVHIIDSVLKILSPKRGGVAQDKRRGDSICRSSLLVSRFLSSLSFDVLHLSSPIVLLACLAPLVGCLSALPLEEGMECSGAMCGPALERADAGSPYIVSVDGEGTYDSAVDHADHRVQDSLLIKGRNLSGATASLVHVAGQQSLAVLANTAEELRVSLPDTPLGQPSASGAFEYTLRVMNAAGQDEVRTFFLQGEAGVDGDSGIAGQRGEQGMAGADNVITEWKEIVVPANDCAGLLAELDELNSWTIRPPGYVRIRLSEGVYECDKTIRIVHPNSKLLQLMGSGLDGNGEPATILSFASTHGVFLKDGAYLRLDEITLRGPGSDVGDAPVKHGIYVIDGSHLKLGRNVIIENFKGIGLLAQYDSLVRRLHGDATGAVIARNNGQNGFQVQDGATAVLPYAQSISNGHSGFYAGNGGTLNASHSLAQGNSHHGFNGWWGANILANHGQALDNLKHGFVGSWGSRIHAGGGTATNNGSYGFFSSQDSMIYADNSEARNNTVTGYAAHYGSHLTAVNAQSVSNGRIGFEAQWNSTLMAYSSDNPNTADIEGPALAEGNQSFGVYSGSGSVINATKTEARGNQATGFAASQRAYLSASSAISELNGVNGFSAILNSFIHASSAISKTNSGHGFSAAYGSALHAVNGQSLENGGRGFNGEDRAYLRIPSWDNPDTGTVEGPTLARGNQKGGVAAWSGTHIEMSKAHLQGNTFRGIDANAHSSVTALDALIEETVCRVEADGECRYGDGVYVSTNSSLRADRLQVLNNANDGIGAYYGSYVYGRGARILDNGRYPVLTREGGRINVLGAEIVGVPEFPISPVPQDSVGNGTIYWVLQNP
jgi:hypothetical protein